MKSGFILMALLASSLTFGQSSDRGGHDGGGGQGVVCYNSQNQIESVELLDLYEGRHLENLQYQEVSGTYEEILGTITEASDQRVKEILTHGYKKIRTGLRFMAKGMRLKPIEDANTIFIPANCKTEQIVNFQGMSRIFIVTDFWDKLSETNKAALLAHEILWTSERSLGVIYSSRARRAVARMFANNYSIKPLQLNLEEGDIECWAENDDDMITAEFYIPKNGCKILFKEINSGDIYGVHEAEFFEGECTDWKNYLLNKPTSTDIEVSEGNTIIDVIDVGENISSHEINLSMVKKDSKAVFYLNTKNWEFSGFNTKNHKVECFEYRATDNI